jgi:phospholipid/cholesterol/gamma-HCH transport system permease protein
VTDRTFEVDRVDPETDRAELRFSGELNFRDTSRLWREVRELLERPARSVRFDLSAVAGLDGGSTALLLELQSELSERGTQAEIVGAQGSVRAMLDLYRAHPARPAPPHPEDASFFDRVGRLTLEWLEELRTMMAFLGDVLAYALSALRAPRSVHWRDLGDLMVRAGVDALPIIILINFLVGLVVGFQAAVQLEQVGADILIADLVVLSVVRELGPLMTAIVVAGRSGAAYAAELGTMKVSEEIDALETLRLDPYRFLVLPRLIALVVMVPMLTLVADGVGALGGLVVAVFAMDLTVAAYLNEAHFALVDLGSGHHVAGGLVKSVFFGAAIALIACQRGLVTQGGAAGVGRSTTSAVVTTLFVLILVDAGFTILGHVFDF